MRASMPLMLRISEVRPLEGRLVELTLTDGSVVERDLSALLDGVGVFEQISFDDAAFREVYVDYGTLAWPGEVDIAPETLIWDGPDPADAQNRSSDRVLPVDADSGRLTSRSRSSAKISRSSMVRIDLMVGHRCGRTLTSGYVSVD
jgi:hypothetical protein